MSVPVYSVHHLPAWSPEEVAASLGDLELSGIQRIADEILELAKLPGNWDGENAVPVVEIAAKRAMRLAEKVSIESYTERQQWALPDSVEALNSGSILLTWFKDGSYTMATITASEDFVVVVHPKGQVPRRECVKYPQAVTSILQALA